MESGTSSRDYPIRDGCVFCRISSGDEPARYISPGGVETEDRSEVAGDGPLAFRNRLTWVRVMALVIPQGHPSQEELWSDPGLFAPLLRYACGIGRELTIDDVPDKVTPEGFRVVSNFGRIAHQSQHHAHVHVIARPDYEPMPVVDVDAPPHGASSDTVLVEQAQVVSAPWSVRLTLPGAATQEEMWAHGQFPGLVGAAVTLAEDESPEGYRFAADFLPEHGMGPPGFFILGGGQLDLYA
ncbi:MAG: HIT family protein [Chloroflexi bacterium]|nr:HIT family protein [Chloroflexota bacterium]